MSKESKLEETSSSDDTQSIKPYESPAVNNEENILDQEKIGSLYQTISRSISHNPNENVLTRLETLTKAVSHLTADKMNVFEKEIDPNDFDLIEVLEFISRSNEEQGLSGRLANVEFQNLSVIGKNQSAAVIRTVADNFFGPAVFIKDKFFSKNKPKIDLSKVPKTREIIRNVTGYCEAGQMLLVLGRPGAGCSTFLKTIAGETDSYLGTEGEISYSGIPQKQMVGTFKDQLIYTPELDVHFPYLTVEQTLDFAVACKTPNVRVKDVSRSVYIKTIRDIWCTVFGLSHVTKTLVGSDFVRGVSGGQRKRVSIAEAMVTRASVYCFDNATRGLDASTALEFIEALRSATNISKATSLVTAYQASEGIYENFDLVSVLYLGHQIYFGPARDAKDYFIRMGYYCPPRQSTPEFLTAVTDPLGRTVRKDFQGVPPQTPEEFEQYWLNSPEYQATIKRIQELHASGDADATLETFHRVKDLEKMPMTSKHSKYTINYIEQLKICVKRGFNKMVNNRAYTLIMVASAIIQSLIVGSEYYNTPQSTAGVFGRGGLIFFAVLFFSLLSLAEVSNVFQDKPILNKQRGYSFVHPSAELLSSFVTNFPVKLFSMFCFSLILYFLANLKREAGAFFSYLLFLFLTATVVNSLFILLASLCPSLSSANGLAGLAMMSLSIYSSFMLQRSSMVPWFKWFSYMNPILYGFESMIAMEFHGREMECADSNLVPFGKGYENITHENQVCAVTGAMNGITLQGDTFLKISYGYKFSHVWRNFGILLLFLVGFLFINSVAVEIFNPSEAAGDKLNFIKGATLPADILDQIESDGNSDDDDTEANVGIQRQVATVKREGDEESVSEENKFDSSEEKLGSNDIFMWQHVDYVIQYDGADRKLLDDVQGYVKPGTLTALMGESGAGKTTLLNVLSGRVDVGVVTGDMFVNGRPISSSFKRRTGYVQQQDLHIAELTVRESLIFAARLRRPLSVPDEEKIAYVDKVIDILQMNDYVDAIAGKPGFGLNVEQRKKLSIATELVAKPSLLLFLDEPTSGLDSQSSWAIVSVMRELAKAGQAILCTIHQPSATLFESFDRLLLLRRGGQTVYFGDIGKNSENLLNYFESNGARKCEPAENPAEYILEAIGAGATAVAGQDWFETWLKSEQCKQETTEIEHMIEETRNWPVEDSAELNETYATPYLYQMKLVTIRTATQLFRDLDYIMAKFTLTLLVGLLSGFTYWNVKHTAIGMQNLLFANFLAILVAAPYINQTQGRAIESRELFEVRESKSNTFHWSTLLVSQFINEIPYSVVFGTIYFICWYFPIQLDNDASRAGFWFFSYAVLYQLYHISLALWIIYCAPDLPSASVIISLLLNFIISFCGVVQPPKLLPHFWKFMWRASPLTYFIENLLATLLHDRKVVCAAKEMNYVNPPDGMTCGEYLSPYFEHNNGYVANPNDSSACGVCQYSVGDEYLSTIEMSWSHRWRNIGLFFVYIGFNLFAMVAGYYAFRVKRLNFNFKSLLPKKKQS